jgi:hypothetical protein
MDVARFLLTDRNGQQIGPVRPEANPAQSHSAMGRPCIAVEVLNRHSAAGLSGGWGQNGSETFS